MVSTACFAAPIIPYSELKYIRDFNEEWSKTYLSSLQKKITFPNEAPTRWGRLLMTWAEVKPTGEIHNHTYSACIDTKEWSFYVDHRPREIFERCLAHLLLRPLMIIKKTLYHLSIVIPLYHIIKKGSSFEYCLREVAKSMADIVRTPLFGIALIVSSIAMLCICPFGSDDLALDGRRLLGKLEQMSTWGEKKVKQWTMLKCFQPWEISYLESFYEKNDDDTCKYHEDTLYEYPNIVKDSADYNLEVLKTHFLRRHIQYLRRHFDYFKCHYFPQDAVYTSPILETR